MNKPLLKEKLEQQRALSNIYKSSDFQNHVLPVFKHVLSNHNWLSPEGLTQEEFNKKYNEVYWRVNAYKEILSLFENAEDYIKNINEELKKPTRSVGVK